MNSAPSGWIAGERLLLRGGERVHRIPGDSCFGGGRSYGFEPRYNSRNLGAPKVERLTFFLQVLVLVVYRARHVGLLVVQDPGDHMAGNLHLESRRFGSHPLEPSTVVRTHGWRCPG